MADTKISDLAAAASLADTDLFVIAQEDTANKKVTFPTLRDEVLSVAPGFEFEYQQITSNVNVSATTEASANTIITADAVSFDGSTLIEIIFYSQLVRTAPDVSDQQVVLNVFEDGSDIGRIAQVRSGAVGTGGSAEGSAVYAVLRRTPASGSRTYSIRGWVTTAGTAVVQAGAGGSAASVPAFLALKKV